MLRLRDAGLSTGRFGRQAAFGGAILFFFVSILLCRGVYGAAASSELESIRSQFKQHAPTVGQADTDIFGALQTLLTARTQLQGLEGDKLSAIYRDIIVPLSKLSDQDVQEKEVGDRVRRMAADIVRIVEGLPTTDEISGYLAALEKNMEAARKAAAEDKLDDAVTHLKGEPSIAKLERTLRAIDEWTQFGATYGDLQPWINLRIAGAGSATPDQRETYQKKADELRDAVETVRIERQLILRKQAKGTDLRFGALFVSDVGVVETVLLELPLKYSDPEKTKNLLHNVTFQFGVSISKSTEETSSGASGGDGGAESAQEGEGTTTTADRVWYAGFGIKMNDSMSLSLGWSVAGAGSGKLALGVSISVEKFLKQVLDFPF